MKKMKISIISPCLNNSKQVRIFLSSLFLQKYPLKEVIMVDGGSKDETINTIKHCQKKYPNLKLIKTGFASPGLQRNKGAEKANGELLFFLDSDIFFDDASLLEKTIQHFEDTGLVCVCGITCQQKGSTLTRITYYLWALLRLILSKLPFPFKKLLTSSSFIAVRKKVFEEIGGFKKIYLINEDGIFGKDLCNYIYLYGKKVEIDLNLKIWHYPKRFKSGWFRAIQYYFYIIPSIFGFLKPYFSSIQISSEEKFKNGK
jgi:glycosyltransferase involved in cell wall biosynthesis